ncbi:hypothetical protein [Saccharothrix xinjiangensis]|uniref:Uncharacterized protein n=1 Tax=Saccharothrix xinjiangensis TaxID=204798 RepID=A0ABV9YBE9_9PSEU
MAVRRRARGGNTRPGAADDPVTPPPTPAARSRSVVQGNAARGLARFDEDRGRKLHPAAF